MNNQVKELFDYCYNAISSQKDAQGQDLINLEELDKRLSVLIMDSDILPAINQRGFWG